MDHMKEHPPLVNKPARIAYNSKQFKTHQGESEHSIDEHTPKWGPHKDTAMKTPR
jgi:hypothetical protein